MKQILHPRKECGTIRAWRRNHGAFQITFLSLSKRTRSIPAIIAPSLGARRVYIDAIEIAILSPALLGMPYLQRRWTNLIARAYLNAHVEGNAGCPILRASRRVGF
jgi:hypothetical protein